MDALFRFAPLLRRHLPVEPLTELPTPLHRLLRLGARLELPELWIKREDQSASPYGGNKVRKLELLLAAAKRQGAAGVLTYGAIGSHHALATAIYARHLGLSAHVVLIPQPPSAKVAFTLARHLELGTSLHPVEEGADAARQGRGLLEEARRKGKPLYEIPMGGSSPLGSLGYVAAGLELATQVGESDAPPPDRVYVACGTMGTAVGLALGLRLARLTTQVEAVRVVPTVICQPKGFVRLFDAALAQLRAFDQTLPDVGHPLLRVTLRHDQYGEGYALSTPAAEEAVELLQELEQVPLETTYTGKALAALVADARAGRLKGERVLFINTYAGIPSVVPALKRMELEALPPALRPYLEGYLPR